MTLQVLLIARAVTLIIFASSFFLATAIIELDRRKHNRGPIGHALRNLAASSGLFLLSTASLAIAAIYSATQYYQALLGILLWIGLGAFALWLVSTAQLLIVLKRMNDDR